MTGLPEIQAGPIHFEHLQYKGFSFENKCQSYKIEMRRYRHIWYYLMEVCSGRLMTAGFWAVCGSSCCPEKENPAFYPGCLLLISRVINRLEG